MNSVLVTQRWEIVMMHRWLLNLLKNDVIFHLQRVEEETAVLLHANPLIGILHSLRVSSEVFLEKWK